MPGERRDLGVLVAKRFAPTDLPNRPGLPAEPSKALNLSGVVTGVVVDEMGSSVVRARVTAAGNSAHNDQKSADTDIGGRFQLSGLPVNTLINLYCSHPKYDAVRLTDIRANGPEVRIVLKNAVHELIGKEAPALSVGEWVHSQPVVLEQLRGKVVILQLGGSTFQYQFGNAELIEVTQQFHASGLATIVVLSDPDRDQALKRATMEDTVKHVKDMNLVGFRFGIDRPARDGGETQLRYGVLHGTLVLIDRTGKVRGAVAPEDLAAEVEKLLAE